MGGEVLSKETQMIHMVIPKDLLERIDDYRFKNRYESRAEAMRFLMEWALNHNTNKDNQGGD